jgi:hypothetical protein
MQCRSRPVHMGTGTNQLINKPTTVVFVFVLTPMCTYTRPVMRRTLTSTRHTHLTLCARHISYSARAHTHMYTRARVNVRVHFTRLPVHTRAHTRPPTRTERAGWCGGDRTKTARTRAIHRGPLAVRVCVFRPLSGI